MIPVEDLGLFYDLDLRKELEEKYFTDLQNHEAFSLEKLQEYWHEDLDLMEIQDLPLPPSNMRINVSRDPYKGELTGYYETQLDSSKQEDKIDTQESNMSSNNSNTEEFKGMQENPEEFLTKIPLTDKEIKLKDSNSSQAEICVDNIHEVSLSMISKMAKNLDLNKKFFSNTNDSTNVQKTNNIDMIVDLEDMIAVDLEENDEDSPEKWYKTVNIQEDFDINESIPDMAFEWKFELDKFQKHAICHLELGHSVFVAAHTSAGKTAVAEYAIALSIKHMTRTIYTSPIKALSNQKFRDFRQTFTDVGLLTGDVQINPDASCLIMTTEILRSMLYMGNKIIKELEYIIFDEVHYINDADRGVVWEEVLILLPESTKLVLLSATVPNVEDFASWIGKTKKQIIYICKTEFRPVPLQYSIYMQQDASFTNTEGKRMYSIENNDDKRSFYIFYKSNCNNNIDINMINKAQKQFTQKTKGSVAVKSSQEALSMKDKAERQYYLKLVRDLSSCQLLPIIIFIFSKARINNVAEMMQNSLNLLTQEESNKAESFFNKAIIKLKKIDRDLPQIQLLRSYIKNGYAIHHSGILPILKEIVEILFQLGLIKVLIATETFGMGVNMPARTVVFTDIEKFDGTQKRTLLSGEFTQMSGRAGRRGTDDIGHVVICAMTKVPNENKLVDIIGGDPEILKSKFRLTYRMILSLLRVEILKIEDVIKDSFLEFSNKSNLPQMLKQVNSLNTAKQEFDRLLCDKCLPELLNLFLEFSSCLSEFYKNTFSRDLATYSKWLTPGRLIYADCGLSQIVPMILLRVPESNQQINSLMKSKIMGISFPKIPICIMYKYRRICTLDNKPRSDDPQIHKYMKNLNPNVSIDIYQIKELGQKFKITSAYYSFVFFDRISSFTNLVVKIPQNLTNYILGSTKNMSRTNILLGEYPKEFKNIASNFSAEIKHQVRNIRTKNYQPGSEACLDLLPLSLQVISAKASKHYKSYDSLEKKIFTNNFWTCSNSIQHLSKLSEFQLLESRVNKYKDILAKMEQLQYLPEYRKRSELLKFMKHIDSNNVVSLKGRVACEFCVHELLLTEMLLSNSFKSMKPEVMAALLSSLVHESSNRKKDNAKDIKNEILSNVQDPDLQNAIFSMIEIAHKISQNQKRFNISNDAFVSSTDENLEEQAIDYSQLLNFELCQVVYKWARGESFSAIIYGTQAQEGIVVRCIQRLEELLRNLREAARIIGEVGLFQKTDETITLIKRDIVFTASLYTD